MNENEMTEIEFNGVKYVRKDSIKETSYKQTEGMKYCIFRGHECGVHAGYLKNDSVFGSPNAFEVVNARRLWRWDSKFTLTELANNGVRKTENCKFSEPSVNPVVLLDVYEVLPCTEAAAESIEKVGSYVPNN